MTEEEFTRLWIDVSSDVADEFYPKGISKRRGEYLRDQAILHVKLVQELSDRGLIQKESL